jgi:hypothetical protein
MLNHAGRCTSYFFLLLICESRETSEDLFQIIPVFQRNMHSKREASYSPEM